MSIFQPAYLIPVLAIFILFRLALRWLSRSPSTSLLPKVGSTTTPLLIMDFKFNEEDSQLIAALHALSKSSPRLVQSSTYNALVEPKIAVCSWKMNEYKYTKIPSPFPTLARGLFTMELPQERQGVNPNEAKQDAKADDKGQAANVSERSETEPQYRIVVRGYDKFFNIGEVPWTTWEALERHTAPPYTLTLKSNGCIIFIAALTPEKLLVTSKHSTGSVVGYEMSHAQAGEMWLGRYLEERRKKEADLASQLWENNWTAIAELCDDSFEEHVLGYPPEKTGLHLHGLNECSKHFKTLPQDEVDAFAEQWGFIKTAYIERNTINEVRSFTQECAEKGGWKGEAVEGFVVRTHVTRPPTGGRKGEESAPDESPYPPGSTFFFKVKFDEPYLMYRDWREVTKILLSQHSKELPLDAMKLPKSKMKRKETRVYVKWVIGEIQRNDSEAFREYSKGKGIIATRERFLDYLKTEEGLNELATTEEAIAKPSTPVGETPQKTIILPVAIPGCGKTSVAIALAQLFSFGHTQSDDFSKNSFLNSVVDLLDKHDVVIADRGNHQHIHRQQFRDWLIKTHHTTVRFIALDWLSTILSGSQETALSICGDRILDRGDRHQKLSADPENGQHERIIWRWMKEAEELNVDEVDESIDMNLEDSLEDAIKRAVDGLVEKLGLTRPSDEQLAKALQEVHNYRPKVSVAEKRSKKEKSQAAEGKKEKSEEEKFRYYAFRPEVDLGTFVEAVYDHASAQDASRGDASLDPDDPLSDEMSKLSIDHFWKTLKTSSSMTREPHVTVVHKKMLPNAGGLWNDAITLSRFDPAPQFKLTLGHLLWNERVMALTVDGVELDIGGEGAEVEKSSTKQARRFLNKQLDEHARQTLHITVGTAAPNISPLEAKDMVKDWREANGKVKSIRAIPVPEGRNVVYGPVKGFNS